MNIFLFDPLDLERQAKYHPDKLVVKMQLEATQLLNNHLDDSLAFYKKTHIKHPCSIWLGESEKNLSYGLKYLESLINEYEYRYKKISSYREKLDFLSKHININLDLPDNYPIAINIKWMEEFVQEGIILESEKNLKRANPNFVKTIYREYLLRAKTHYAEWRYSSIPDYWYNDNLSIYNGRFCRLSSKPREKMTKRNEFLSLHK